MIQIAWMMVFGLRALRLRRIRRFLSVVTLCVHGRSARTNGHGGVFELCRGDLRECFKFTIYPFVLLMLRCWTFLPQYSAEHEVMLVFAEFNLVVASK